MGIKIMFPNTQAENGINKGVGLCAFVTVHFTPWFNAPFRRNQTKSMVNNQTFLLEL